MFTFWNLVLISHNLLETLYTAGASEGIGPSLHMDNNAKFNK